MPTSALQNPSEKRANAQVQSTITKSVPHSSEQLVSQLLMAFVDRKVAPQTIVDVVRAQIFEQSLQASQLSCATCNGILEVITAHASTFGNGLEGQRAARDIFEILVFIAQHSQFPDFLSAKAARESLAYCMRHHDLPERLSESAKLLWNKTIVGLGKKVSVLVASNDKYLAGIERTRILNLLKNAIEIREKRDLNSFPNELILLREQLENHELKIQNSNTIPNYKHPLEILGTIAQSEDHTLAQKGVHAFQLSPKHQKENWRLHNIQLCRDSLNPHTNTPYQMSFIVEWFCDGMFKNALQTGESLCHEFKTAIKDICETALPSETDLAGIVALSILKGLHRALQRDFTEILLAPQNTQLDVEKLARANSISHEYMLNLMLLAKNNMSFVSRKFIPWALQLPVNPQHTQLLTRKHWQWIRTLCTDEWEEDLKEVPPWIQARASRFTAQIFSLAPSYWLHDFCLPLLERLHAESLQPQFEATAAHCDVIEFIIRALRRKSPWFASRQESLHALKAAGRTKIHEEQQIQLAETRQKIAREGTFKSYRNTLSTVHSQSFRNSAAAEDGSNAIARSLAILIALCQQGMRSHRP